MDIITRDQWDARAPRSVTQISEMERRYFVVHHSGGPASQSVRAIQDWCMDGRGFSDIDYNFLIRSTTGEIYRGRGWNVVGAHAIGYNRNGLGVCVIGDNHLLCDQAKRALRWLRDEANRRAGRLLHLRGHGELTGSTDCPGSILRAYMNAGMPAPQPEPEEPDMTRAELLEILKNPDDEITRRLRALPWQYAGNPLPPDKSILTVVDEIHAAVTARPPS